MQRNKGMCINAQYVFSFKENFDELEPISNIPYNYPIPNHEAGKGQYSKPIFWLMRKILNNCMTIFWFYFLYFASGLSMKCYPQAFIYY